ncbi:MAG: hypothetical protein JST55_14330 [Bacteroidetes bacterium]|nr:hypothetical protein [Bacteroidota bacterium]
MKKILLLAVIFLFLINFKQAISQNVSETEITKKNDNVKNSLEKNKWALQFTIDQNFTLSNFEGSIASVKKQFSPNRALRLGLSVEFGHSNQELNKRSLVDTTQPEFSKYTDFSVFIYPTYLFYINPSSEVNVYFGTGITTGGSYYWRESEQNLTEGGVYYAWNRTYSYGGGLTGTVGVEFFPMKSFSIIAEYFVSLQYSHNVEKSVYDVPHQYEVRESTYDEYQFFGKRVNFGLSVYF